MNCQLLFVYGTLRRGFSRHKYLKAARARFISRGTIRGKLFDLGAYPGAIPSDKLGDRVRGEVYRLPDPELALQVLDEVEGVKWSSVASGEYRRERARVTLSAGSTVEAWVYWLNRHDGPRRRISSGKYTGRSE